MFNANRAAMHHDWTFSGENSNPLPAQTPKGEIIAANTIACECQFFHQLCKQGKFVVASKLTFAQIGLRLLCVPGWEMGERSEAFNLS